MPNETIVKIKAAFADERGAITNILEKDICHVAVITSIKGAIRANHYHPKQMQYVYLISGKYRTYSKDLKKKDAKVEELIIEPGMLAITPPMIAHAMEFLEDSVFINMTDGNRDSDKFEEHTIKYKLI